MPEPIATWNAARDVWETDQACIFGHWAEFSATWPASGSMRSGVVYERLTSAPRTSDTGCSSSPGLPTPTARDWKSGVTLLATGSVTEPLLPTPVTTDAAGTRNATANRQPGARPAHTGTTLTDALCPPLLPTPTAVPYGNNQSPSAGAAVRPSLDSLAPTLLPTPTARLGDGTSRGASHPARRKELCQKRGGELDEVLIHTVDVDWGRFEPAIRRWEVLTRLAPSPTEQGPRGGQRLNPRFVEWMMNLPDGHVTGVPGLSRNDQLKALGNGVVPAQAEAALRSLLTAMPMPTTRATGAA